MKTVGRVGFIIGVVGLMMGCASFSDGDEAVKTHYTLEAGPVERADPPLPSRTPIHVKWHYSNGKVESNLNFIGWDFDHDGRYEMVQVLNGSGETEAYVYDFDGDGQIDKTVQISGGSPANETLSVVVPFQLDGDEP